MSTGTLNILSVGSEVFTPETDGAGNFNGYLDFGNLSSDQIVEVTIFINVAGAGISLVQESGPFEIDLSDITAGGDLISIPAFSLEALQVARVGVKLISGTPTTLDIPFRITDLTTHN